MTRTARRRFAGGAALAAGAHVAWLAAASAQSGSGVDFERDVLPIFEERCHTCHGPKRQKSDFRLDLKRSALKGGFIGGAIVPGDAAASRLIHYVEGTDPRIAMPPKGERLAPEQIALLRAWIDEGASWPDAPAGDAPADTTWWSLRPIERPRLPAVERAFRIRNPIDAFVLHELEARGLRPSPEADRRTLIRRVALDLTGLPPSPEEVDAFVADPAPDAYERLVDRLLASPRYGERWARHWMDAVHFAETHGHDEDRPRPNAWPYRDWLIESFNADEPYDRFVRAQLAGDVLFPDDPRGIVALGFIAAGPWDESSQMGIVDGTTDKKIGQLLDRDDMVTTAMSTFASATVHCARCHDHKFDPIPQADYYALQAVFAGVDRAERPFDPDPVLHARRRALLARQRELESAAPDALLAEAGVEEAIAGFERAAASGANAWVVLDPEAIVTNAGTTAARQPDGSLLFGGSRPERDSYRLTARPPLEQVTAIRVAVLTDPSLPHEGPGRQDNGNLHLSEFRVGLPEATAPLAIRSATADFDQQGWTVAHAIDGDPGTAWGIYPEVGKSHSAVFELAEPLALAPGAALTFVLDQLHGGGHLIGRLQLSATAAADPRAASVLPAPIAAILATPREQRDAAQRAELARHVLLERLRDELAALPPPRVVYAATSDFEPDGNFKPARGPRPVHVLRRGDVGSPIEEAAPGALSCLAGLPARFDLADPGDEGARRAALAVWLTDSRNVLAWRSIVNRVWHHHFGRGIVDTLNDFGRMGSPPTHPELLDWLAAWFRDDAGRSLKALHRLIVTSSTWRQSSRHDARCAAIDGDNRFLWRMNRTRLDAEQLRDAVLQGAGLLDLTMGGPSVKQFLESPGIHVTPVVDYAGFDVDAPENRRRAIYRFLFRTLPDPLMESLDCPDASQLAPARGSSMTVLQALSLLHNKLVVRQSEHLAARIAAEHSDPAAQAAELCRRVLLRAPTREESRELAGHAARFGLANACRVLWNCNEFVFVE